MLTCLIEHEHMSNTVLLKNLTEHKNIKILKDDYFSAFWAVVYKVARSKKIYDSIKVFHPSIKPCFKLLHACMLLC